MSCADELCWVQGKAEAESSCVSLEKQTAVPEAVGISPKCFAWAFVLVLPFWSLVALFVKACL